jgi:hypothetical protein
MTKKMAGFKMLFSLLHSDYARIYYALTQRNFLMLKQRYKSIIINAIIQLLVYVMLFGYLFPLMAIPSAYIGSLYLGTQTLGILFFGMGFGLNIVSDIKYSRFIDYHLTLPLAKRWLFASYVTYFLMEVVITITPLMTLGIILLGPRFQFVEPHWLLFIFIYLLIICFAGILFLGLSLYYDYDWFMENLWPRRLSILVALCPFYFTWKAAYHFSPRIAQIMLLNPFTYTAEGMRAALIGGSAFIALPLCFAALIFWNIIAIYFAWLGIVKRLDPV